MHPVGLPDVIDRDDMRVAQIGGGDRLALEAPQKLSVHRELRREHFERDLTPERGIDGAVDPRHPAPSDLGLDLIAPERPAHQRCHT